MSEKTYRCPCCKKSKKIEETPLEEQRLELEERLDKEFVQFKYKQFSPEFFNQFQFWACNQCLQDGLAIRGNFKAQNFGVSGPYFAYIDEEMDCNKCGKKFMTKTPLKI